MQSAYQFLVIIICLSVRHPLVSAQKLLNIAVGKPVIMSSTLNFSGIWKGDRMVDGNINTNATRCNCCASTGNEDHPWITIDLLQEVTVLKIDVKGRTDQVQPFTRLGGVEVYAGDNTSDKLIRKALISNNKNNDPIAAITANVNVSTRKITIKRPRQPTENGQWFIVVCELEIFTLTKLRNVALGKPITTSSTLDPYYNQSNPSSAVDGNISKDINMCGCCVSTGNEHDPWLTVDLQGQYLIQKVVVTGRIDSLTNDMSRNLENIQIVNGDNSSTEALSSQIEIVNNSTATVRNLNERLISHVTLKRPDVNPYAREWYLTVCEIEIYVIECPNGTYGRYGDCKTCGHCKNGRLCDGDGNCPGGCDRGYTGGTCQQGCVNKTFGNNCSDTCGHCKNGRDCDRVTGQCPEGCQLGFTRDTCKQECVDGTYGDCSHTCGRCKDDSPCNKVDGNCVDGCSPRYIGDKCQTCLDGYYSNCTWKCGNCFGSPLCDHVTGYCPKGCTAGYKGNTCHDECESGKYGNNCSENCGYCLHDKCYHVTGHCLEGCQPGYRGDRCHEECPSFSYGRNCSQKCGHCVRNETCNHINGTCGHGCSGDFVEDLCQTGSLKEETAETQSSLITTVSVSVSVGVVAVVAAVIIIVFVKRRARPLISRYESADNKSTSLTVVESEYSEIVLTSNEEEVSEQEEVNEGFRDDSNEPQPEAPKLRDYYTFDKVKNIPDLIYIQDLWCYIQDSKANNCNRFYEDYKTLPSGLQFEHEESLRPENRSKNRYREIVTYDHSRVVLHVTGADQTDYINASFIDGYERVKKFIASQGPMPSMINDFWRMIWQQNTTKIVMLTNLVEMGKDKCDRYWPEEEGEEEEYGEVRVRLEKQDIRLDFCIRTLTIQQGQSAARHVTQYHFNSWPDKDIPDSAWCLVNFWRTVTEQQSGNPIVVHCSAGVGRTGTFIALDVLYEQARAEGGIKPLETVERLRRQRIKLVQTKDQYVYLHEAVAEALLLGPQSYWPREVPDVLSYLQGSDPGASQTRLQVQYQLMCKTVEAMTKKNEPEYGNVTKLEVDENRPKVSTKPLVQDLKLNNFNGVLAYIVTLAPTEKTMDNLWTKLRHYGAKTIINISGEPAKHLTKIQQLGADGNAKLKKYNVYLLQEKTQKSFTVRTFDFKEVDRDDNALTTVKQYDITGWKSGKPSPDDVQSLPLLVDEIFRWQSDIAESQPLIITCSTEWTRCGLVVAIMNEALRMRYKDCRVNILDTVIGLKRTEGRFITYEQFEYLYDVVISCIKRSGMAEDSGVYSNI